MMKTKTTRKKGNPFVGLNQNAVLVENAGMIYAVSSTQEFSPLRQYSEEEFTRLLQYNPSFLATDGNTFEDKTYLRNLSLLYVSVTNAILEKSTDIKRFFAKDIERAVLKLEQEHPVEYATLCKEFCIDPKHRRALPNLINISHFTKEPLIILSSWGYAELYSPNLLDVIPKIAEKLFSASGMSDTEKVKYAHIFFMFVHTFNRMPYDQEQYETLLKAKEKAKGEAITSSAEKQEIFDETLQTLVKEIEPEAIFQAIMLENAYEEYFKDLPENYLDADAIEHWLNNVIGFQKYAITSYVDLSPDIPMDDITYNIAIRTIKEAVFPYGKWTTGIETFKLQPDENVLKSMQTAFRKYCKNGFRFGAGVETFKKEHREKLYCNPGTEIVQKGYLYANSPVRLRISDCDEMDMIKYTLCKCNLLHVNI